MSWRRTLRLLGFGGRRGPGECFFLFGNRISGLRVGDSLPDTSRGVRSGFYILARLALASSILFEQNSSSKSQLSLLAAKNHYI